ncbi:uncharacterized protein TNCV_3342691 [Trichonephila clavipes]|nr:uncharacterized protein TNCV_3342691 [Trichonephila clavipes]
MHVKLGPLFRTDKYLRKEDFLRFIFGESQENGIWRRTSNFKLYHSHKESDIVNFIKIQQIKWAGHAVRMDEDRTTKTIFNARPIGTQRKDRPNLRWIDGLEKDLPVLRIKNWRALAGRRLVCKRLLEKVKAPPGLLSHRERKEGNSMKLRQS